MKATTKTVMRQMALVGSVVLGLTQTVGAFGTVFFTGGGKGRCYYSLQLQNSVSVRRDYLVKLDEVLRSNYTAGNTVDEMYDNIVPASYNDDSDDGPGAGTGSISISFGSPKKKAARSAGNLDFFTIDCLGCHDGLSASSIGVDYRDNPFERRSRVTSSNSDHPIGMTYDLYAASRVGYKDVGNKTKMVFVNGKVGCLTCHDPLNPEKGHLVMSDRNSELCRTCHDK